MRKNIVLVFVLTISASSCVTTHARLGIYLVSEGVHQYFLSPTTWQIKDKELSYVQIDITYRAIKGSQAICNISFFGKKTIPDDLNSFGFITDGQEFELTDSKILFPRPEKNELRWTSKLDGNDIIKMCSAKQVKFYFKKGERRIITPAPDIFYYLLNGLNIQLKYSSLSQD